MERTNRMITRKIAEQFIAKLREDTDLYVDVIDKKGIIQASLNPHRLGTFHKIAYDLIDGDKDEIDIDAGTGNSGQFRGIVLSVKENGVRVGAITVAGVPDEIRYVASVTKMALETRLEYEAKYESFQKYSSSRDIFNQALMYGENITREVLESRGGHLGIKGDCLRIAVFIVAEPKMDFSSLVLQSPENPFADEQDIVAVSRSNRIAVFKYLQKDKSTLATYRYQLDEYFQWWRGKFKELGVKAQFNVGTIQDDLVRHREAYQHAVWLVTSAKCQEEVNWFYDYTDQYFLSMVPTEIHRNVFKVYAELMDNSQLEYFPQVIGALDASNYNFIQASQKLFIHKNTTAFRLDKIKAALNVNPVKNQRDREFANNLLYYLRQTSR